MPDDPITLDDHREMAAQRAADFRRRLVAVEAAQAELRRSEAELGKFLVATPALTWREAGQKARVVIMLLAATPAALDPRHQALIAGLLQDMQKLSTEPAASNTNERNPDSRE